MLLFLLRRAATFAATLLVASLVVFAVLELLPGSPAQVMLGDTATPESIAALEARLGLDRSAAVRYGDWVGGLLRGRLVQTQLGFERGDRFGRACITKHHLRRLAGQQFEHREDHQRRHQQRGGKGGDAAQQKQQHGDCH